ncbi:PKD domain-containing protein [Candidatus Poseidoniales archaeon]|mgnify:FL=1|jgi:PKD repeat protein|nr:PKD domain-containing protein [Candidatus Poseidoniales archaeon]MDG1542386.1 PKD domain-containing protein [Candidatus Thalassarchaeaceae archaeon]|tara:strand:- start:85 stop:1293 length:1209 start_codon:yes stop_codon:yes gene_type:complete
MMARVHGLAFMLVLLMISTPLAGCLDSFSGNNAPSSTFSMNPNSNIRAGDEITFNAAGSSDPDGDSLTFTWNFGDGNIGSGLTTTHSYVQDGEYSVKLTVSDGSLETTTKKTVNIIDPDARVPQADISSDKDEDCDGESAPAGQFVLIWVCEEDKEISDKSVEFTTKITLDASDSWAGCDPDDSDCYAEEYIVEWNWDLDTSYDSDNDGDFENDIDATGEVIEWENLPSTGEAISGGAWEVSLTVIDNNGLTSSEQTKVYVNYRGVWSDFEIDRRLGNDPIIMSWEYPVSYNTETDDRIRYLRIKLIYPKEDDGAGGITVDSENILDIYVYNNTDDEVANTSAIGADNRDAGDCDSDDHCVWMVISGSTIRGKLPGDWTADIQNEKTHNTEVKHFIIELQYR